jgi:methylthioribose-1-phosphate isomerase
VANKIGTYTKAVLAHRHGIPFYVAIPLSTIDWELKRGFDIPIEERADHEVLGAWGVVAKPEAKVRNPKSEIRNQPAGRRAYVRIANPTSPARNPGFDVTPAELITGIITPVGIFKPCELWARRRELQAGH